MELLIYQSRNFVKCTILGKIFYNLLIEYNYEYYYCRIII